MAIQWYDLRLETWETRGPAGSNPHLPGASSGHVLIRSILTLAIPTFATMKLSNGPNGQEEEAASLLSAQF